MSGILTDVEIKLEIRRYRFNHVFESYGPVALSHLAATALLRERDAEIAELRDTNKSLEEQLIRIGQERNKQLREIAVLRNALYIKTVKIRMPTADAIAQARAEMEGADKAPDGVTR